MPKSYYLLVAAAALGACKKPADAPAKTELLTASRWRVSARTHTATFSYGGPTTTDEYATMGTCEKDNFTKFNADKTVVDDEGATKCDAAAPQTAAGTWSFSGDEARLSIVSTTPGSPVLDYDVLVLSASTLRLRYTYISTGSSSTATFVTDITYSAF